MAIGQMTSKKAGSWTKVVIFVSLYVLLLESVIEWALVLYLYGNRLVDSKMAPSLILALIAVRALTLSSIAFCFFGEAMRSDRSLVVLYGTLGGSP